MDVVVVLKDVDVEDEVVELEDELVDSATLLLVMAALHWADDGGGLGISFLGSTIARGCEKK